MDECEAIEANHKMSTKIIRNKEWLIITLKARFYDWERLILIAEKHPLPEVLWSNGGGWRKRAGNAAIIATAHCPALPLPAILPLLRPELATC